MPMKPMVIEVATCIRTLRLKVKAETYPWLNAAAIEVNQVWNWGNATRRRARHLANVRQEPARWRRRHEHRKGRPRATHGPAEWGWHTSVRG
jgi:hypothetical protein